MSRTQETPRQDEIAKYLSEHPLSSAKDVRQGLGGASSTIGVRLLKMYEEGIVTREQDEEHVYRYVLKDATPPPQGVQCDAGKTPGIKQGEEMKSYTPDAKSYAGLCIDVNEIAAGIWYYLKDHPDSTEHDIADGINSPIYRVEGYLLWDSKRQRKSFECVIDENGVRKYSCIIRPKATQKVKTLDDFTPREMFEHLKKLGFKWKPGSMFFEEIKRTYVEFDKI